MDRAKIEIRIGKKFIRYNFKNGATLKDIKKEFSDWLAKIFEGEIVNDYNGEESSILIIIDRISEIKIEKKKKEEKMETKENYDSKVWFRFKNLLTGIEYKLFVYQTMKKFLKWADPNLRESLVEHIAENGGENYWNKEGGITNIKIKGEYIFQCKMYYFDEKEDYMERTIIFRNHFSPSDLKTVFFLSDAFEEFLILNNIPYERTKTSDGNSVGG